MKQEILDKEKVRELEEVAPPFIVTKPDGEQIICYHMAANFGPSTYPFAPPFIVTKPDGEQIICYHMAANLACIPFAHVTDLLC